MSSRLSVAAVLFPDFELLDVFGPLEMFGMLPDHFEICLLAQTGDQVASAQGPVSVLDANFESELRYDILLVPGGSGTRREVDNAVMLDWLRQQSATAKYVTSVCTGSALLARAGLLDGIKATTNKAAFDWVAAQGTQVDWQRRARWVEAGRFYTSSGVSAGIDMSLALISHLLGQEVAEQVAIWAEYEWHQDSDLDPFADIYNQA